MPLHGFPDGSEPFPKGTTAELDAHPIRPNADTALQPPNNAPQKMHQRLVAIRVGISTSSCLGYPFMAHSFGLRITINRWAPIINRSIWPKHDDHAALNLSICGNHGHCQCCVVRSIQIAKVQLWIASPKTNGKNGTGSRQSNDGSRV